MAPIRNRHPAQKSAPESDTNEKQSPAMQLGHISERQILSMAAFGLGTKAVLMTPSLLALEVGSSAWISALIGTGCALFGFWGWSRWSELTSGLAAVPALRMTLGRVFGDLLGLVLLATSILSVSLNIRVQAGGAVIGLLPQFPIEVLILITVGCGMYTAWLGLEPVARVAVIYTPVVAVSIIFVIIGAGRFFDVRNLVPIWGLGLRETLLGGLTSSGLFAAIPMVLVWKSYARDHNQLVRGGLRGVGVAGLAIAIACASSAIVFPYPEVTRLILPMGEMARAVYLGRFLQRLEAIFTFVWFFSTVVQISILQMSVLILIAQLANTHTYRPFVPGLTVVTFALAALPASFYRASTLLQDKVFEFVGPVLVAFGWVLFAIAKLRGVSCRAE